MSDEALDAVWLAVWTSRFKFRDDAATGPDTFYAGIVHAANIIGSPETRAEPGTTETCRRCEQEIRQESDGEWWTVRTSGEGGTGALCIDVGDHEPNDQPGTAAAPKGGG